MLKQENIGSKIFENGIEISNKFLETRSKIKSYNSLFEVDSSIHNVQESQEEERINELSADSTVIKAAVIVGKLSNEALRMAIAPIIVSGIAITGEDPLTGELVSKKDRIKAILELPFVFVPTKPAFRSAKKVVEAASLGRKVIKAYRDR